MKRSTVILLLMLIACNALATIRQVRVDYATIQEAIDACVEGDTVLIGAGYYDQSFILTQANILLTSNYTFTGQVWDINNTHITWSYSSDAIGTISSGLDSTTRVIGLTFEGQRTGIFCSSSSPIIENCVFRGATIRLTNSSAIIRDCTLEFSDIESRYHYYKLFARDSSPRIENCVFTGNGAGGGLLLIGCSAWVENCVISDNWIESRGGGICLESDDGSTFINNLISGNRALLGGGVYASSGAGTVFLDCTIENNMGWQVNDYHDISAGAGFYVINQDIQLGTEESPINVVSNQANVGMDFYFNNAEPIEIFCDRFTTTRPDSHFVRSLAPVIIHASDYLFDLEPTASPQTISPDRWSLYTAILSLDPTSVTPDTIFLEAGEYGGFDQSEPQPTYNITRDVTIIGPEDGRAVIVGGFDEEAADRGYFATLFRLFPEASLTLRHVAIENTGAAIVSDTASLSLSHVECFDVASFLHMQGGDAILEDVDLRCGLPSRFIYNYPTLTHYSFLRVNDIDNFTMDRAIISDLYNDIVFNNTQATLRRLILTGGSTTDIFLDYASNVEIINSLLTGQDVDIIVMMNSEVHLVNCTVIDHNMFAITLYRTGSISTVINSIFSGYGGMDWPYFDTGEDGICDVRYSLVHSGYEGEGNITEPPRLTVEEYRLRADSPCIDAGAPDPQYMDREDPDNPGFALWPSVGGVRNDMGAYGGPTPLGTTVPSELPVPEEQTVNLPRGFTLDAVYPNPFNAMVTVQYSLPRAMNIQIELFNLLGRQVAVLVDGHRPRGQHRQEFHADGLSSGLYFLRMTTPQGNAARKVVLVK